MLDLAYSEDSKAEVDMNVVMTASGRFVEVQGTAEGLPCSRATSWRNSSRWPNTASPRSSTTRPRCSTSPLAAR